MVQNNIALDIKVKYSALLSIMTYKLKSCGKEFLEAWHNRKLHKRIARGDRKLMDRKYIYSSAMKGALPICVGYLPLGFACGVALQSVGVHPVAIALMSILVYAGGGQFIAASLIGTGAGVLSLVSTILIVNLRHILLSWTLSPYLSEKKRGFLFLYAGEVTDESFAVNYVRFQSGDWSPDQAIKLNHIAHFAWVVATVLGGIVGGLITFDVVLVNFVLTSMFICLMCMQLANKLYIIAGAAAAALAVLLKWLMGGSLYIIISAVAAATLVYFLDVSKEKREAALDGE